MRTLLFFHLPSFESEVQSGLGRMELNGQIIDCHENSYRIYIAVWLAFSFISRFHSVRLDFGTISYRTHAKAEWSLGMLYIWYRSTPYIAKLQHKHQ